MGQIQEILMKKGRQVWTIGPTASALQAALVMSEHNVGGLVVLDQERIVGMFTERDLLHRVVAAHQDPGRTPITEVMTTEVACCTPETTVDEARGAMRDRRVRHLPVVTPEGRLQGLISIGDLNAYLTASQEQTIFLLNEYLYGRV